MISAQQLTKYYGDTCAVERIDFEIQAGEIVGILGLNGAGKTTTLRVLSCLLLPSSGSVTVDGIDITEHPHEIRKRVGFLPESPPLYTEMTVESYLRFTGYLRGLDRRQCRQRLEIILEATETTDVRREVIANLSHGYKQRVGIGQALIHDPPVLILDEPIKGLDPRQIVQMRELVRRLGGDHTILVSSHILSEISQTCDRILVIDKGRIVATGTEAELTADLLESKRLRLQVRGDADEIVTFLRGLNKVTACRPIVPYATPAPGDTTAQKRAVALEVETKDDIREQIAQGLIAAGFGLLQLTPVAELESVFLKLTHSDEEKAA